MKETCIYLLCFLFYSIVGWAFEVTLYLIRDKKFVNRGFLNGPYCPVYGSGGIMIWLLFGNMQNPLGIFLSSAVAACTLEYLTSYIMEKLFHARWWDYSEMKFNLNGRICLLGAVTFGTFAILLVYLIHPAVSGMLEQLPDLAIYITAGVLGVLFVVDCIVTVSALLNFHQHLEKIFGYLDHAAEQLHKKHRKHLSLREIFTMQREQILRHLNWQQRRIILAFPRMQLHHHDELLAELREALHRYREKK